MYPFSARTLDFLGYDSSTSGGLLSGGAWLERSLTTGFSLEAIPIQDPVLPPSTLIGNSAGTAPLHP